MNNKTVISLGAFSLFLVFAAGSGEDKTPAQRNQDRQKGFHCLSSWDGSHREVVRRVEQRLRDPDSFEHIETRITPVNAEGFHLLFMTFRAQNGFGGMNVGEASATIKQSDCSFETIAVVDR